MSSRDSKVVERRVTLELGVKAKPRLRASYMALRKLKPNLNLRIATSDLNLQVGASPIKYIIRATTVFFQVVAGLPERLKLILKRQW